MPRLCAHAATRTGELLDALTETTHRDGAPMFQVYGPASAAGRGATVAFNVLDRTGRVVPYEAVEACGRRAGVAMRGGCFCNPGAAESAFAFPAAESLRCLREASARGFTPRRFAECIGGDVAVGALRASAGAATSAADLRRAVDVCAGIADAT